MSLECSSVYPGIDFRLGAVDSSGPQLTALYHGADHRSRAETTITSAGFVACGFNE